MAKGKKQQGFSDPLGSVFDFIFTSPKKKPVKTKPRKIKPGDANQMLARGLAEIAARPANYISDAAFEPVKQLGNNITLVDFHVDSFDGDLYRNLDNGNARVRIRASELGKFMTNPNGYIDAIFNAAAEERKLALYLNIGRGMDTALLATWAKKQGLTAADAAKVGFAASNLLGADQFAEAKKKHIENIVLGYLNTPGYGKGIANDALKALGKFKGQELRSPEELDRVLREVPGLIENPNYKDIVRSIWEKYEVSYYGKKDPNGNYTGTNWQSGYLTEGKLNRWGYLNTVGENYLQRAKLLDPKDPKQREEQFRLLKAYNVMQTTMRLKGPGFDGDHKIEDLIKQIKGELNSNKVDAQLKADLTRIIANLESSYDALTKDLNRRSSGAFGRFKFSQLPPEENFKLFQKTLMDAVDADIAKAKFQLRTATNEDEQKFFENMIATLDMKKRGLLTAPFRDWRIKIADMYGIYRSVSGNFGKGFLGGVIGGSFFFADDLISPGKMGGLMARRNPKNKYSEWYAGFVAPKSGISEGYSRYASLYYLTPGSLFRTAFYNGEWFAYRMFVNRERLFKDLLTADNINLIKSVIAKNPELLKIFLDRGMSIDKIRSGSIIADLPFFQQVLEPYKDQMGGFWKVFDAAYMKDQKSGWSKALAIFGAPSRAVAYLNTWYQERIRKKVGMFLYKNVYSKLFPKLSSMLYKKVGERLITQLTLRQALSVLVADSLAAVSAAFGPLGWVASTVIIFVAEGLIDKIFKPFVKMFMGILWFLILFLFFFIGMFAIGIFNLANPKPFQHIVPTDALECVEENPFQNIYKKDPVYAGGNYGNAPANSTCPILSSSMVCTQGDGHGASTYHQQRHSLDIGTRSLANPVWYAPTDGRVGNYSAVNYCSDGKDYGGALSFFDSEGNEYILLHVKALATGAVKKGQPVAITQFDLQTSYCWTGPHFHLEVKHKGGFVDDTESWYRNELKCNIISYDPTCHGK